jgi:NADPH2:quinone reductase
MHLDACEYSQKIHLGIYLKKQMKTIQVDRHGNADVLKLTEIETPKPQAGQALIKIHYAGVNFIDVAMRRGWYPNPAIPTPFTPGVEGAGEVIEIGEGVTEIKIGDRVSFMQEEEPGLDRAYAEYIPIAAWKLIPLPNSISFETAAAMTAQGLTTLFDYINNREERIMRANAVWAGIAAGWLKPQISQVFALEDAIAAHQLIEDRNNMGKILLKI